MTSTRTRPALLGIRSELGREEPDQAPAMSRSREFARPLRARVGFPAMSRARLCTVLLLPITLSVSPAASAAVVGSVFGGRVPCVERDGVQFCEGGLGKRVESFDGVPLDV